MVPRSNPTRHSGRAARGAHSLGGEAIEQDRVPDPLHAGRPAGLRPAREYGRALPDCARRQTAVRVPVELGRGSVNRIEVFGGLAEGDEIILSDTSARDTWDAIRLR